MISIPDELKPVADRLAHERRLSYVITELLKKWYALETLKTKKNGDKNARQF